MAGTWAFEDVLNTPLTIFLLQLALTLFLTRLLGAVLGLMKQPQVIGEIIAGIIMGPSVLGHIPGFTDVVFPTAAHVSGSTAPYNSTITFSVIANAGLILFMFLMGLELDRTLLRKQLRLSLPIAISAIAVPFGIGCALAVWLNDINSENQPASFKEPNYTAFVLFMGASLTFTAFPVLAAILAAAKLMQRPIGVLAMSNAAIDDIVAWCVLAISTAFAKSGNPINGVYTLCLSAAYVAVMVFPIRLGLRAVHKVMLARNWQASRYYFCGITLLLIGSAYCTEAIGIHPFFGAFLMGLITPHEGGFVGLLFPRMELVVMEVLLPLYFANSGIRTNIGTLNTGRYWGITLAIILIASLAKFVPAAATTKLLTRRSWRFSATIGILMNTRGLVEIIALNIGLSLGILSTRLFTMLILMAIATTVLTSPLVWLIFLKKYPDGVEEGELVVEAAVAKDKEHHVQHAQQGQQGLGLAHDEEAGGGEAAFGVVRSEVAMAHPSQVAALGGAGRM